jgi:hypothetical protein
MFGASVRLSILYERREGLPLAWANDGMTILALFRFS